MIQTSGRLTLRRAATATSFVAWWRGNRVGMIKFEDGRWLSAFLCDNLTDPSSWHSFETKAAAKLYLTDFEFTGR